MSSVDRETRPRPGEALAHDLFDCPSPDDLLASAGHIRRSVERVGYCLIRPWSDDPSSLKVVANLFGPIQSHIRANAEGIVGEGDSVDRSWQQHLGEYHGISNEEFTPHTDGTFLDGAVAEGNGLSRVHPPQFVVLQCVCPAHSGGANTLVDSLAVFNDIAHREPDLLRVLLTPGCVTFCRDDQIALDQPVYRRVSPCRFVVRFRHDAKVYSPSWSADAMHSLHHDYHMNPHYGVKIRLEVGEILVVDNHRVLHAREAFTPGSGAASDRKYRRVWVNRGNSATLFNPEGLAPNHRALSRFVPYRRVGLPGEPALPGGDGEWGIKVPEWTDRIVDSLLWEVLTAEQRFKAWRRTSPLNEPRTPSVS